MTEEVNEQDILKQADAAEEVGRVLFEARSQYVIGRKKMMQEIAEGIEAAEARARLERTLPETEDQRANNEMLDQMTRSQSTKEGVE